MNPAHGSILSSGFTCSHEPGSPVSDSKQTPGVNERENAYSHLIPSVPGMSSGSTADIPDQDKALTEEE